MKRLEPRLHGKLLQAAMRESFLVFLHRAFLHLEPNAPFLKNWHLEAIGHRLDLVQQQGGARLVVNVPPRSLKSITISVAWVAWMLGRDPTARFICVSYASELALKHSRDCRDLMTSDWYRKLFPSVVLERSAEQDLRTTLKGGRLATSVGGTLTGLGGDYIIIDDPLKPDEAASATARQNAIDWYNTTLSSRLNNKNEGSIIVVMQRVHELDLAGHLLAQGGFDHLNLPAIAQQDEAIQIGPRLFHHRKEGDLLHPERESQAVLDKQKGIMGSALFSAQYLQAPLPAGGVIIKREWIQHYDTRPRKEPGDLIVQSWDCASKEGVLTDYSVCVTALVRKKVAWILDVYRARVDFPELKKAAIRLARDHGATELLIEEAAAGIQLLQTLRIEAPEGVPRPITIRPKGDKQSRVYGVAGQIEAGSLLLPREDLWLATLLGELLGFPNGAHDDQVDAVTQLLLWLQSRRQFDGLPAGPVAFTLDEASGNVIVTGDTWWIPAPSQDEDQDTVFMRKWGDQTPPRWF